MLFENYDKATATLAFLFKYFFEIFSKGQLWKPNLLITHLHSVLAFFADTLKIGNQERHEIGAHADRSLELVDFQPVVPVGSGRLVRHVEESEVDLLSNHWQWKVCLKRIHVNKIFPSAVAYLANRQHGKTSALLTPLRIAYQFAIRSALKIGIFTSWKIFRILKVFTPDITKFRPITTCKQSKWRQWRQVSEAPSER